MPAEAPHTHPAEAAPQGCIVRSALASDGETLTRLIEDALGVGCFDTAHIDSRYARVCEVDGEVVGAVLMLAAEPSEMYEFCAGKHGVTGLDDLLAHERVGHLRYAAVDPAHRRQGIGGALMRAAESACRADGITAFYVIAWVRADSGACEGGALYERAGYSCLAQIPDFYREWSFETSTVCPACGEPPCVCEARVYVKKNADSSTDR